MKSLVQDGLGANQGEKARPLVESVAAPSCAGCPLLLIVPSIKVALQEEQMLTTLDQITASVDVAGRTEVALGKIQGSLVPSDSKQQKSEVGLSRVMCKLEASTAVVSIGTVDQLVLSTNVLVHLLIHKQSTNSAKPYLLVFLDVLKVIPSKTVCLYDHLKTLF